MLLRARCRMRGDVSDVRITPMSLRLHASQYRSPERMSTRAEQTWQEQAGKQLKRLSHDPAPLPECP